MDPRWDLEPTILALDDLRLGATAAFFEGGPRAGVGVSMFVLRTRPGGLVELHTHPYPETFLLLEGRARWTVGSSVAELEAEQVIAVPAWAPHGFRNVGEHPLLVVSVQQSGTLEQTFLGIDPR